MADPTLPPMKKQDFTLQELKQYDGNGPGEPNIQIERITKCLLMDSLVEGDERLYLSNRPIAILLLSVNNREM